jgi:phosphoribosyl 1,2-cyclic phosphate phosphodiesterase
MKVRFLGTGTSTGIPQIGCRCQVCNSSDSHDKRLRTSVAIEVDDKLILIDCTPDFRQQVLPLPFRKIEGLLFTHEHYDHMGGIDDLRPYSVFGTVDLYMEKRLEKSLREKMPYCFYEHKYGGIPDIRVKQIDGDDSFYIDDIEVVPIRVMHYKLPILGFRIRNFAYLTDVKTIPEIELTKLVGVETLVISALRKSTHISHLTLDEALKVADSIGPKETWLTHLSHEMGLHAIVERELPPNVHLAYDGLELSV